MRLVFVEWEDSFGCSSRWENLDGCQPSVMLCRSVGWLLHDGDDCKVVVPHVSTPPGADGPQGCGDMTIPAKAVVRMVDLIEPSSSPSSLEPSPA